MYLAPDADESGIADEAGKVLADLTPLSRLHHGDSPDLSADARQALAGLGWFALSLPEAASGSGLSEVEFALFFREVGRQCAPLDLLSQSLAVLLAAGQPQIRDVLLSGEHGVSLLIADNNGQRVLGGRNAWALEVTPDFAHLLDIDGVATQALSGLDPAVSMARLQGAAGTVVLEAAGDRLWNFGKLGVAAMLVGITEAALDMLVEYAKVRQTFGRPIGSYQAVRHPCADIAMRLEAARCQLWFAAAALKESRADALGHLDAAKHLANEAATFATDLNIQLHGGIGVTDEHDAHILMKHTLLLRKLFGAKRAVLAQLLHARFGD